jgi:hypothetical protein
VLKTFYVTIPKFDKHQKKQKPGYSHILLSKRFFQDEKVVQCRPNEVQLYLYCLIIASELGANHFAITSQSLPKQFRISNKSLENHLKRLESFQLLRLEKPPSNIIEYNNNKGEISPSSEEKKVAEEKIQKDEGWKKFSEFCFEHGFRNAFDGKAQMIKKHYVKFEEFVNHVVELHTKAEKLNKNQDETKAFIIGGVYDAIGWVTAKKAERLKHD